MRIVERIKIKSGMMSSPHQNLDNFLEEATRKTRDGGCFNPMLQRPVAYGPAILVPSTIST